MIKILIQIFSYQKFSSNHLNPQKALNSTSYKSKPRSRNSPKQQSPSPSGNQNPTVDVDNIIHAHHLSIYTSDQNMEETLQQEPLEGLKVLWKNHTKNHKIFWLKCKKMITNITYTHPPSIANLMSPISCNLAWTSHWLLFETKDKKTAKYAIKATHATHRSTSTSKENTKWNVGKMDG